MGVVSFFNEKFTDFRMLVFRPQMGARRLVRKASLGDGVKLMVLFAFLAGLINVLLLAVGQLVGSLVAWLTGKTLEVVVEAAVASIIAIMAYVILFLPVILAFIIISIVWYGMIWGMAKLLGGKSEYGMHFGMMCYPLTVFMIFAAIILGVLNFLAAVFMPVLPILAVIISWGEILILLLLALYTVWLKILVTAEAHQIDMLKAGVAVVLPSGAIIIAALVVLVIFSAIFATLFGLNAFSSIPLM
ncbi:hypothetical protein ACFLQ2_01875 [archaeon]